MVKAKLADFNFFHPKEDKILKAFVVLGMPLSEVETQLVDAKFIDRSPEGWLFVADDGRELAADICLGDEGVLPGATIYIRPKD